MPGCDEPYGEPPTLCDIVLSRVATLGADAGAAGPTEKSRLLFDKGLYYLAPTYNKGEVSVFDASGRYLHSIGKMGGGPGENREVARFSVIDDTIFVYDAAALRISKYITDGTYLGSDVLVTGYAPFTTRIGGALVLMRDARSPGPATIEILSNNKVIDEFTVSNESTATEEKLGAMLTDVDGSSFWLAFTRRYLFEQYSYRGRRLARVTREMPWFPGGEDVHGIPDSIAGVVGIDTDAKGTLKAICSHSSWFTRLVDRGRRYTRAKTYLHPSRKWCCT